MTKLPISFKINILKPNAPALWQTKNDPILKIGNSKIDKTMQRNCLKDLEDHHELKTESKIFCKTGVRLSLKSNKVYKILKITWTGVIKKELSSL